MPSGPIQTFSVEALRQLLIIPVIYVSLMPPEFHCIVLFIFLPESSCSFNLVVLWLSSRADKQQAIEKGMNKHPYSFHFYFVELDLHIMTYVSMCEGKSNG